MADEQLLPLDEGGQTLVGQFRRELHQLVDRMMSGTTGVGANITKEIVGEELGYVQNIETNTLTIELYLNSWLEQFRENLIRTKGFDNKNSPLPTRRRKSAMVVGAGPSLTDEQLETLRNYKGYLICSNKALERVLQYRCPDMVAVIHTTADIAEHFKSDIVRANLYHMDVVASSCIHPDTTFEILKHVIPQDMYWFNASIPFKTGLDDYIHALAPGLMTIDTGGNVGIFMCQLAEMMGYDTIGILGMEHCLELDPNWTNEEAMQHAIYYAPEDDPVPFAMNQAFTNYLLTIQAWFNDTKADVYNLTPKGLLYISRRIPGAMPYMGLKEFVEAYK